MYARLRSGFARIEILQNKTQKPQIKYEVSRIKILQTRILLQHLQTMNRVSNTKTWK